MQEFDTPLHCSTFWTDSTCVLRQVENLQGQEIQVFVSNRFSVILDHSSAVQWRYVKTALNSVDETSRRMKVDDLLRNGRWKHGPDFVKQPGRTWPQRPDNLGEVSGDDPGVKKNLKPMICFQTKINATFTLTRQQRVLLFVTKGLNWKGSWS